ncbi:MAG: hypothetical protein IJ881_02225 [Neisseriaceae bacterium]|nr:hypothetical protein [Neisseriaceae bacterium]MBR3425197.1 hypothetical protein [Neisseriaceae bacterium]
MSQYTYSHFLSDYVRRTLINHELIEEIKKRHENGKKNFCYEEFFREYKQNNSPQFNNTFERDGETHFYEVTSLINSLYGLVIMPVEKFSDPSIIQANSKIDQAVQNTINNCEQGQRYYSEDHRKDASTFLKHIRNALAHGGNHGIHFYSIGEGQEQQIGGIIFVDYDTRNQQNLWCIKLTIQELQSLTKEIYSFFCTISDSRNYRQRISNLEKLLSKPNDPQVRQQIVQEYTIKNNRGHFPKIKIQAT